MICRISLLFVALWVLAVSTPQCVAWQTASPQLDNGIYLVQRWTIDREDLFPLFENEVFFEYDEDRFLELSDDDDEPVRFVALDKTWFLPFELATPPDVTVQGDGRNLVGLTFSPDMSEKMKVFSRRYLGRQVATVVDGQILTLHKIRSVIDGGKLQISRCTDRGCDLILSHLSEKK